MDEILDSYSHKAWTLTLEMENGKGNGNTERKIFLWRITFNLIFNINNWGENVITIQLSKVWAN